MNLKGIKGSKNKCQFPLASLPKIESKIHKEVITPMKNISTGIRTKANPNSDPTSRPKVSRKLI